MTSVSISRRAVLYASCSFFDLNNPLGNRLSRLLPFERVFVFFPFDFYLKKATGNKRRILFWAKRQVKEKTPPFFNHSAKNDAM